MEQPHHPLLHARALPLLVGLRLLAPRALLLDLPGTVRVRVRVRVKVRVSPNPKPIPS